MFRLKGGDNAELALVSGLSDSPVAPGVDQWSARGGGEGGETLLGIYSIIFIDQRNFPAEIIYKKKKRRRRSGWIILPSSHHPSILVG